MTSVVLPAGVTTIEQFAFQNCSNLEYLELSSSLAYLGNGFISGCNSLKILKANALEPPIQWNDKSVNPFDGFYVNSIGSNDYTNNCILIVPFESGDSYQTNDYKWNWKNIEPDHIELPDFPTDLKYGTNRYGEYDFPKYVLPKYFGNFLEPFSSDSTVINIDHIYKNYKEINVGDAIITVEFTGVSDCPIINADRPVHIAKVPLTITAPTITLNVGDVLPEIKLTYDGLVSVYQSDGYLRIDSEESIGATISETLSTEIPGVYTITPFAAENKKNKNYDITYVPGKLIVLGQEASLADFSTYTYGASPIDLSTVDNPDLQLSYTSSNLAVAKVENGKLVIVGAGTAKITATCGNAQYTVSVPEMG